MKKKFLSVLLIVAVLIGMAGVSGTQTESGEQKADKEQKQQENEQTAETKVEIPPENEEEQKGWIGVILNGDETEAYTLAHIDGIRAAAENVSLPEQDIIFNSIPASVLDEAALRAIRSDAWLIEIAAGKHGFDLELAGKLGVHFVIGQKLPGTFSPHTGGRAIAEAIVRMIREAQAQAE